MNNDNLPLAMSIQDAVALSGIGRTSLFAAIKAGELKVKKYGRRTLVLTEDLKAWIDSLPSR